MMNAKPQRSRVKSHLLGLWMQKNQHLLTHLCYLFMGSLVLTFILGRILFGINVLEGNPPTPELDWSPQVRYLSAKAVEEAATPIVKAMPQAASGATPLSFIATRSTPKSLEAGSETTRRRMAVRQAMHHAWSGYDKFCFGKDDLEPLTKTCKNWLQQGTTIVDSLDTLYLMGFQPEFKKARDWVASSLDFSKVDVPVSFFETIIRVMGGLLSAYDFSHDKVFLNKAKELADRLDPAWGTATGVPYTQVNMKTARGQNPSWLIRSSVLSEIGTIQMELFYLAYHTGEKKYFDKAQKVIDIIDGESPGLKRKGLFPNYIDHSTGKFTADTISFGAMGDSAYEYFLKVWIVTGKKKEQYRRMYETAMDGMIRDLVKTDPDGLVYVQEIFNGIEKRKMDHLACFVPGMLALGVAHGAVTDPLKIQQHVDLAKALTKTCFEMYSKMPTGIAPEYMNFSPRMNPGDYKNHLRPEAVESFFIMWRLTGDPMYREWGWTVFQAFEKVGRVPTGGYAGLKDVRNANSQDNAMETFFLAETLKYLYLLFSDEDIPLDKYVFNTEAHPLSIFSSPY